MAQPDTKPTERFDEIALHLEKCYDLLAEQISEIPANQDGLYPKLARDLAPSDFFWMGSEELGGELVGPVLANKRQGHGHVKISYGASTSHETRRFVVSQIVYVAEPF